MSQLLAHKIYEKQDTIIYENPISFYHILINP